MATESYYHVTTSDNIDNLLGSGKINTLKHLAKSDPDHELDVELSPIPVQVRMSADNAYGLLKRVKNVGEVHFTRDGYLPNYGDVVIEKKLGPSVKKRLAFNTLPEEYTTPRSVSLRDATVYVPSDRLDEVRKKFGGLRIRDKSELGVKPFGFLDRIRALGRKAAYKVGLRDDF